MQTPDTRRTVARTPGRAALALGDPRARPVPSWLRVALAGAPRPDPGWLRVALAGASRPDPGWLRVALARASRPIPGWLRVALAVALISTMVLLPPAGWAEAAPDRDRERAIELFKASQDAYQAGRFTEAAKHLTKAYRLDPNPILLYNLARARESAGELDLAVRAYRRYLREAPDAEDRPAIEARVATLERQIAERARLEALVAAERRAKEAAAREARRARRRAEAQARAARAAEPGPVPWIVTGLGAAALATGVTLGILASDRQAAARDRSVQREAAQLADEADGLALGANIAYAAGGTLALGGLLWMVLAPKTAPSDTALSVGPSGVTWTARF